jgi:alkanesulfonate monooxygenase SsuD/methylene tetrahydromethanopterin reductase-like flavin-dependent oxidoreductase (luciferase family)
MRIGVGLPAGVPGASGQLVIEWARRADMGPFSSLGVVDRLAYNSHESLMALAAAAAVTHRVRLATTIIIGPLRNTTILAKEAASLAVLSGGRLVLGLAVGARQDDYTAAGVPYRSRGKRLTEQLADLRDYWEAIGPQLLHGMPSQSGMATEAAVMGRVDRQAAEIPVLIGGLSDQTFARVARYADGYVHGGGSPRAFARAADRARAAWHDAGRPGKPQLWAQGYYALGDDAVEAGVHYLRDYYAFTGPFVERIVAGLLTTPQALAQFMRGYQEAGCDELILFPAVADIAQLDRLAAVIEDLHREGSTGVKTM